MDLKEIADRINGWISYSDEAKKWLMSDSWLRKKLIANGFEMKAKCIPWLIKVHCSYCNKIKEVEYNETDWGTKKLYYCDRKCQNAGYRLWQHIGRVRKYYPAINDESNIAYNWKNESAKKLYREKYS